MANSVASGGLALYSTSVGTVRGYHLSLSLRYECCFPRFVGPDPMIKYMTRFDVNDSMRERKYGHGVSYITFN